MNYALNLSIDRPDRRKYAETGPLNIIGAAHEIFPFWIVMTFMCCPLYDKLNGVPLI